MRNQPVKSLHTGSYQLSKHCIALAAAMTIALASWQSHAAVSDFETDEYKAMGSLHLINASSAYDLGYTGKGIVIGLIDQIANANHSELSGKTTVFHGTRPDGTPAPWPQTPEEWSYQNHGTHVAGIAAGNRNGSLMHGVAFDSAIAAQQFNGAGEVFEWSEAFLKTENLRVINNSWSRGQWVDPDKFDLYGWKAKEGDFDVEKVDDAVADMRAGFLNENDAITRLIRWAQSDIGKKGVVVFSAGNGGVSDVALPGLAPRYFGSTLANWITVVNADNRFTHLEKDSGQGQGTIVIDPAGVPVTTGMAGVGKLYTVMAPGNWINSADASDVDGLMRQGGTSMAAPHVSGAIAVVAQAFPWMTGKQLADTILTTANSNIRLPKVIVTFNTESHAPSHLSFYVTDPSVLKDGKLSRDDMVKYATESYHTMRDDYGRLSLESLIDLYIYEGIPNDYLKVHVVEPEDIYGQGYLDLGKAVGGIARLDVNRMSKDAVTKISELNNAEYAMETFDVSRGDYAFTNDIEERLWDDKWHHEQLQYGKGQETPYNADAIALHDKHAGIIKRGLGQLTLSGTNTYQGATIVEQGALSISKRVDGTGGELINSDVVVRSGAWLTGDGHIHRQVINQGVLLPGSVTPHGGDALYIHDFHQGEDGTLLMVLAADGTYNQLKVDRADVRGKLWIGLSREFYANGFSTTKNVGDLIVQMENDDEPSLRTMSAAGNESSGLNIAFDAVELATRSPTLKIVQEVAQDNKSFTLSVSRADDAYSQFAVNDGQKQTADAIMKAASDTNGSNAALKNWIGQLDFSDVEGVTIRKVLKETTPASYAQILSASLDARRSLSAMTRQSITHTAEGSNVWAVPLGGRIHRDGTSVNPEVRSTLYGALFGGSWAAAPQWTIGLQGAVYERKDDAVGGAFDFESSGFELGLHAAWNSDTIQGLYATGFASVGWADAENSRMTTLEGPMQTDWTEFGTTVSALTGWRLQSSYGQFGPFVGLEYNTVHQSDVTEDPTKGGALAIDGQTADDFSSLVGVDYAHAFASENLNLRLTAQAAWRHGFSDATIESQSTFAGNRSVAINGVAEREGRDSVMLGASFAMENKDGLSLSVSVLGEANAHANSLFGALTIQKRF